MKTTSLEIGGETVEFLDLAGMLGERVTRIPHVLRLLCENHIRHGGALDGAGDAGFEFTFRPNRLLMHDTTCTPALADIAAMRDVLFENGVDPTVLSPTLPVHVSVDHSLAVNAWGRRDALGINMANEIARNRERYAFLKWGAQALNNFTVFPPGTGIMHTINLEQLSTLIERDEQSGLTHPDMMFGTDSHTPMVNGIGVLAWGIGGLEAESVMFGNPTSIAKPEIVGVRLIGAMPQGTLSTDLALQVTAALRDIGVTESFVEFFGPGVSTLRAEDRAVVANMAPEYGASTGYFPPDVRTVDYLRRVGHDEKHLGKIEPVLRAQGLWFDPDATPDYDRTIEIDLSAVLPTIAGPRRPQDKLYPRETASAVESAIGRPLDAKTDEEIPDGAVGIAAITSCTNTSDPLLLITAGLIARNARQRGLLPPPWVKTSLAPGSPSSVELLKRVGLLDDLSAVGFDVVGFGCTTCIGNSGDLPPGIERALTEGKAIVAVLSGNRNFPGRVHPKLDLGFLASPPLVLCYALRGTIKGNPFDEPLGVDRDGVAVRLRDIWPGSLEVEAVYLQAQRVKDVASCFRSACENEAWKEIDTPEGKRFPWDEKSRTLRRPSFVGAADVDWRNRLAAQPLLVLGDDVTTDHISPAGAIDPVSQAGEWLVNNGADVDDLNVYASYRGNWEVMLRGLFSNRSVVNYLDPDLAPAMTRLCQGGPVLPLHEVAVTLKSRHTPVVLLAGERYGMGSSRDWAAKGLALMGVRSVIARSFERIHRTNLIAMGILPIIIEDDFDPKAMQLNYEDRILIDLPPSHITPQATLTLKVTRGGTIAQTVRTRLAIDTIAEAASIVQGGILSSLLKSNMVVPK